MANLMTVAFTMLVVCVAASWSLPSPSSALQSSELSAGRRPRSTDNRDLDIFKYMLMTSIKDMVEEGKMNPAVLTSPEETGVEAPVPAVVKRMQYMGICMRRRYNTFIPYPCLRSAA